MPCACGQFIHYAHTFVIHSVSLRYSSFDFITSSLLRFIHFTHLSTTRKSNSFLRFSHTIPQFHSVLQFAFTTHVLTRKQINRTTISHNAIRSAHSIVTLALAVPHETLFSEIRISFPEIFFFHKPITRFESFFFRITGIHFIQALLDIF